MKKSLVLVIVLVALLLVATPTFAQGQPKKDVCHWNGSQFVRITIADPAWDAHSAHGDKEVGVDVDENCQPLSSAPTAVCLVDNWGFSWDLTLETRTGELVGVVPAVGENWSASGSVTPPDLFDTTASSTVELRADNPSPTGCYPYVDYFTYEGTRISGNTFSGTWANRCNGSDDTYGAGDWEGTFYEGECSTVAGASALSSVPGGPGRH